MVIEREGAISEINRKETYIPLYGEDAYRILDSGKVSSNLIIADKVNSLDAHRDAIQLIPYSNIYHRWQYMGGFLSNCEISNCKIYSTGMLQGIFGGDGLFFNIDILNNSIRTKSQHEITIAGLVSGNISNNIGSTGGQAKVRLYPLRIGGSLNDKNIWILSFKNTGIFKIQDVKKIAYQKIIFETNSPKGVDKKALEDKRFGPFNSKDIFIENFDFTSFQSILIDEKIYMERDINEFSASVKRIAMITGDIIH